MPLTLLALDRFLQGLVRALEYLISLIMAFARLGQAPSRLLQLFRGFVRFGF